MNHFPKPSVSVFGPRAKGFAKIFTIAAGLALIVGSANATAVIYEPFNYTPPDTTLTGNAGGSGLTGTWTVGTSAVESTNLTYGSLATSGSATVANGYNTSSGRIGIGPTTLSGLLNDGGGLWMSFLYRTGDDASRTRFAIGLGDTYLSGNGNLLDEDANAATAEQAIGFANPLVPLGASR